MSLGESGSCWNSDSCGTETRISYADRCDCWGFWMSPDPLCILTIWLAAWGRNTPKDISCFLLFLYRGLCWFLLSIESTLEQSSLKLLEIEQGGCFFSSSIFKLLNSSSWDMLNIERLTRLNRDAELDLTEDFTPPFPGPSCNFFMLALRGRTFADLLMLLFSEPT